ncbi:MAG TPA: acyl-CoA ligase (AMP-forming), exosortase A system-associated [Candidatus Competibacteraceae bacterium]|nr:MAG: acyl-CoA ligase (AMP-forming), exosortase A system-associated [Candidatus Competibacteraceae bacterium]HOB61428.1 acyl-CoA ligase (AMP-forming), exosortase A system-associated [Candidatus Competibacteraceae bacterium]HQA27016.1 acyl-CoA ligase (AMP-forming), exosortase A system-associated [Candidatus Competibacteraceae bacterium]HQD57766.1 acyl-CoA ligase (AMP-forming), exosortase A system-associated [Candidatus Competibacteraceae bacterium]
MSRLLHELILEQADHRPDATAIVYRQTPLDYASLASLIQSAARGFMELGLNRSERVAVYLPKRIETVTALFGTALAGGVFVPINPLLKPEQVAYILRDCNVRVLVTAGNRAELMEPLLADCPDLHSIVLVDGPIWTTHAVRHLRFIAWSELLSSDTKRLPARGIDIDMAAILYTSGSTGKPKGVVLSHRNMLAGAHSVAEYLDNRTDDRILAVLPFSFDYGLSQLTTAFVVGASVVLMEYLLPRDVAAMVAREAITGLAAVPPMWVQLARLNWPAAAVDSLRYFTNSGGTMPRATLTALRQALPKTTPYLMYGLTEAFRSTYLPPTEIDRRPDSIGKAIPNAEILVVREDGAPCAPGEPGELVHRGALVALGYWNDPAKTAERFRPLPGQNPGLPLTELAVWSGDTVRMDEEGFLYFIGRKDDMIKTSGYRVSPTEIEEVLYSSGQAAEAAALGILHPTLGQAVVAVIKPLRDPFNESELIAHCKRHLPNFMVPLQFIARTTDLPRNPNGKIDRKILAEELRALFQEPAS